MNTQIRNFCSATLLLVSLVACSLSLPILANSLFIPNLSSTASALQSDVSREEIRRRLSHIAYDELRKGRGRLTIAGRRILNDTLDGGSARVFVERTREERVRKLGEAEENTRDLMKALIVHGKKLPNGDVRIDVETFRRTWGICPLYPFC